MMNGTGDPKKGYTQGGFEDRFCVTRRDGKPISPEARYLILDYSGRDPHAIEAIRTYYRHCAADNLRLAKDLKMALDNPTAWPAQHD